MTRYCLFPCGLACIALLVFGVSYHVGRAFRTNVGDESVTPVTQTGGEIGAGGPADSDTRAHGEDPPSNDGEAAGHVVSKPLSTAAAAAEQKPVPPPPLEIQAMELAATELAINLRFNQEQDSTQRAEMEREIVRLRRQRQALYQP